MEKNKNIAVIGTGMIGAAMAALFTGNGFKATVLDIKEENLKLGEERYDTYFQDLIEKGLVTAEDHARCKELLTFTLDYADIADAEYIFECVFEKLEVKYSVYSEVEKHCKNLKALASSTSALSVEDLAEGMGEHKDKIFVTHPYNPPHLVPLVEVVRSPYSSDEAQKELCDLLEYVGKKVIVMKKSAPGFVANRLQHALIREAVHMVEQGYTDPKGVDDALKYSFAPRYTSVGLFEHQDAAGMELIKSIEDYLFPDLCNATKTQDLFENLIAEGKLGMNSGQGVYTWDEKEKTRFREDASSPYLKYFNWKMPK